MKKEIALAVIFCLTGILIGYIVGSLLTLNWVVDKALWFIEMQGINVTLDKADLVYALIQYKTLIDETIPNINITK